MMKKFLSLLLFPIVCLCLFGCGSEETLPVEDLSWKMTSIQKNSNGQTYLVGSSLLRESYPDAGVMNMTCALTGAEITLHDLDSGSIWKGACKQTDHNPQTAIYEITFDDKTQAHAVSSVTKYKGNESETTLVVSNDEYTIYFSAELPGR